MISTRFQPQLWDFTHKIHGPSDQMVLDTGTILRTTTAHQNHRMLLDVVT